MGLFSDHQAKKDARSMAGMDSGCCGGHGANAGGCGCGHGMAGASDTAAATVKDPVCGMTIDPSTAAATREFNGVTYYFCNPGCADKFAQNPQDYVD